MMRGSAWRQRRLHPARFLGHALMLLGAAAVIGSLAVDEARGIPGWEPVSDVVLEALAAERKAETSEAIAGVEENPPAAAHDAQASISADAAGGAAAEADASAVSPPSSASGFSPLLDLNAATAEELDVLPGIGPAKAKAIIAHRESAGPFRSVDDLLEVKGIGPKLLEQIRPFVKVGPPGGES